jgi:leucyl-tRNA synthetase
VRALWALPWTKKKLTQWYCKITDYADRLLDDMDQLEGAWPEKVLLMQRNWIGRSTGADVDFAIEGRDEPVTVYTTRPDTLYGATFFVVAADSELAAELADGTPAQAALADLPRRGQESTSDIERLDSDARRRPASSSSARDQPGQRRADPGLGLRLRAGRLRHRRDHGGARARPARPRLRARFGLPVRVVVDAVRIPR